MSGENLHDLEVETAKALLKGIRDSVPGSGPAALEQLASAYATEMEKVPSGENLRDLEIETATALLKEIRDSVPDSVPEALEQLASAYATVVSAAPTSRRINFGTSAEQ